MVGAIRSGTVHQLASFSVISLAFNLMAGCTRAPTHLTAHMLDMNTYTQNIDSVEWGGVGIKCSEDAVMLLAARELKFKLWLPLVGRHDCLGMECDTYHIKQTVITPLSLSLFVYLADRLQKAVIGLALAVSAV